MFTCTRCKMIRHLLIKKNQEAASVKPGLLFLFCFLSLVFFLFSVTGSVSASQRHKHLIHPLFSRLFVETDPNRRSSSCSAQLSRPPAVFCTVDFLAFFSFCFGFLGLGHCLHLFFFPSMHRLQCLTLFHRDENCVENGSRLITICCCLLLMLLLLVLLLLLLVYFNRKSHCESRTLLFVFLLFALAHV